MCRQEKRRSWFYRVIRLILLITDIYLPGISGLELKERTEIRNPNIKVILITGMSEPRIRRQAANAGADAFFIKPFDLDDFLDTVRDVLGLVEPEPPGLFEVDEDKQEPQTLSECLADLYDRTGALAAALLDERGEVMAQAGSLPEEAGSESMLSAFITTSSAAIKVSQLLGETNSQDLIYFSGKTLDFFLTNVSESMALLLVADSAQWDGGILADWLAEIRPVVMKLRNLLVNLGVSMGDGDGEEPIEIVEDEGEPVIDLSEVLPELDAVFEQMDGGIKPEEVDEFWDVVVTEKDQADQMPRTDAISYEQAQQLGLAPKDE